MAERILTSVINKCLICHDFQVEHLLEDTYWECDMHFHDYYECMLFISGNIRFQVDDQIAELPPSSLIVLTPNQLHRPIIQDTSVTYERYILRISPTILESISTPQLDLAQCFRSQPFQPRWLPNTEKRKLVAQHEKLLARLVSGGFGADILAKVALIETVIMVCGLLLQPSSEVVGLSMTHSQLTSEIIQYIDDHIHENISLKDLASAVHLSRHYLSRLFKKETSIPIYRFILQKRIIYARDLLIQGTPPSKVYALCGFSDYSNFYRAFYHNYGVSPREYQQNFNEFRDRPELIKYSSSVPSNGQSTFVEIRPYL